MGGLGKTTLVASVYKSERKKFDCHAWISISKTYKVDDLLRRMIEELYENEKVEKKPNNIREMDDRRLAESVRRFLEKKKYLIILDDVWDPKAFDDIGAAINVDDKNGSRVIITTRSDKVASVARDGQKLQPGLLEKTEAWDLFCKRAFRNEDGKCPQELGKLGEEIVSKCQGLPLAIVSIGSLLSLREKTKSEWQKVYDQLSWQLDRNPDLDHVKRVLNLSYLYLPRYLKNCFLHCSMFPEDDVLQRKRLMRLWVAEGLVEERGSSTMEEVAEDYLKELVHRCMLQVVETNEFGRIKHCRMHDIVRELAVSLSKKENFSVVIHDDLQMVVKTGEEKRRLSVHKCGNELQSSMELPRLRTFTVFDPSMSSSSSFSSLCSSSKYLTVLDLQGISIERVPDEIGDLFNLHFLGLRETKVKVLPESLGRLRNLQTLDLFKSEIEKLPSTTENLKKLRHLFAEKIVDPTYKTINSGRGVRAPMGLWNLKDLQTLQAVEANMEFVEQLGNLTQIRSIRIWKVRGIHCEHLCASLSRLRYLCYLDLNASDENEILLLGGWDHPPQHLLKLNLRGRLAEGTMELPLFSALGSSLRVLYLGWSRLREDPLRSLSQLTHLVYLKLERAFDGQQLWFRSRWFPKLKELFLLDLPKLDQVDVEDGAMARLEHLFMNDLPALKNVPRGIEYLTSLQQLYLKDLHPEFIERFEESDDKNKVQHIPYAYYIFQREDQTFDVTRLSGQEEEEEQ
uniref:Disease resistance protein RPM1-like n=2 Tax=Elaeis guineensis var. tenera TaxID=51953 RepID=A0A8N4EW21_ELAGV|nr:disease resistance protein RPM1-like [Elaeis guineensis]